MTRPKLRGKILPFKNTFKEQWCLCASVQGGIAFFVFPPYICRDEVEFVKTTEQLRTEIVEYLRNYISDHRLNPGDRIPSENMLASKFGTNRNTVRSALLVLKARGLLCSSQGKGFFVARQPERFVCRFDGSMEFSQGPEQEGQEHDGELLRQVIRPCSVEEAELLKLEPEETVVELYQLRSVKGQRVAVCVSVLPERLVPGLRLQPGSFPGTGPYLVGTFGLPQPMSRKIMVTADLPEPEERKLLGIPDSVPILQQEILYTINGNKPVERCIIRARGDCFHLSVNREWG